MANIGVKYIFLLAVVIKYQLQSSGLRKFIEPNRIDVDSAFLPCRVGCEHSLVNLSHEPFSTRVDLPVRSMMFGLPCMLNPEPASLLTDNSSLHAVK